MKNETSFNNWNHLIFQLTLRPLWAIKRILSPHNSQNDWKLGFSLDSCNISNNRAWNRPPGIGRKNGENVSRWKNLPQRSFQTALGAKRSKIRHRSCVCVRLGSLASRWNSRFNWEGSGAAKRFQRGSRRRIKMMLLSYFCA